jgi:cell division septation protein DedD
MDETQDTEVTLSTGKLLAMFFGAAIICGIFFSFGYAVGKNSTPAAGVAIMDSSSLSTVSTAGGNKPAAARPAAADSTTPCESDDPACGKSDDTSAQTASNDGEKSQPAPELVNNGSETPRLTNAPVPGSGFIVQVAAVSKAEDADALKAALEKKQYPVFVVDNTSSHLFHVQVGPFADQKEAEAMKTKLAADGYNAILKK